MTQGESVIIHPMTGGRFHALIGDGTLDRAERTRAVYEMIEADEPIHGSWMDPNHGGADADRAHATVLHLAGRHAVCAVEAR